MIHPSRLPKKQPPTVEEFKEQLDKFDDNDLVVGVDYTHPQVVLAPHPQEKKIYKDPKGRHFFNKVDASGPSKQESVVVL